METLPVFYTATLDRGGEARGHPLPFTKEAVEKCVTGTDAQQIVGQIEARLREPEIEFSIGWGSSGGDLILYCRHIQGIAIGRVRYKGEPMRYCLLLSHLNRQEDAKATRRFQKVITDELKDTGTEPAFDLLEIQDRPLLAIYDLRELADEKIVAFTDIVQQCLAIAFFHPQITDERR